MHWEYSLCQEPTALGAGLPELNLGASQPRGMFYVAVLCCYDLEGEMDTELEVTGVL